MTVVLGSGEHRYRVVENWAKLPDDWEFKDAAAVACDRKKNGKGVECQKQNNEAASHASNEAQDQRLREPEVMFACSQSLA